MNVSSTNRRHLIHVFCFVTFIFSFELLAGAVTESSEDGFPSSNTETFSINPIESYGLLMTVIVYFIRLLPLLPLPLAICHTCGLILYNVFPESPKLKNSPLLAPKIRIRVVTRGDYAELIENNVQRNLRTCLDVGMENFQIEIVTDKPLSISCTQHPRVREVVVPTTYRTKTGALFKSRALQYALEPGVDRKSVV